MSYQDNAPRLHEDPPAMPARWGKTKKAKSKKHSHNLVIKEANHIAGKLSGEGGEDDDGK